MISRRLLPCNLTRNTCFSRVLEGPLRVFGPRIAETNLGKAPLQSRVAKICDNCRANVSLGLSCSVVWEKTVYHGLGHMTPFLVLKITKRSDAHTINLENIVPNDTLPLSIGASRNSVV